MTALSIGSDRWMDLIVTGARSIPTDVDRPTAQQLATHAEELMRWNRTINLTAITDPLEIAVKHIIDSMAASPLIPDRSHVLDVGSGGGFPGIVLKIIRPELSVVLVDASRKKVTFLKHVIRLLSLNDIQAIHARMGDMRGTNSIVGRYDVVTCRALAPLSVFVETAAALAKPGGVMIAYKGKEAEKEILDYLSKINPAKRVFTSVETKRYVLPEGCGQRSLVLLKKTPDHSVHP